MGQLAIWDLQGFPNLEIQGNKMTVLVSKSDHLTFSGYYL
jgi:hypothetical protein